MKKLMKRLPILLAFGFIGITIVRIASFASDGSWQWNILGTIFAIMLAMSVYVSSFFLGYAHSRRSAMWSLIFFGLVDIIFNFAETLSWSVQVGRWDTMVDFGFSQLYIYRLADVIYGLFPTVAAALLGNLVRFVSQIPDGGKHHANLWQRLLDYALPSEAEQSHEIAHAKPDANEQLHEQSIEMHECEWCEREFATVQALSAHMRFCKARNNGHANGEQVLVHNGNGKEQ